ncbi:hypothetical protein RDWZM_008562 [Blomia tropicalis]|uniref:TIR domain-containing protein n=1 Tax=Blomia tropicalis TaxID=40697 RepID=A0A9Q0RKG3_BLOTA|nr:hypothetical protein RDWZM_008562 [Blomia tropicalis]
MRHNRILLGNRNVFHTYCLFHVFIWIHLSNATICRQRARRDILIGGLFVDDDDLEPMTNKPTTSHETVDNDESDQTFQHRYLPFRIKFLNDSGEPPPMIVDDIPKDLYTNDALLDFDSPFLTDQIVDCKVKYQRLVNEFNENVATFTNRSDQTAKLQLEISGNECDLVNLVLLQLRWKENITHLVVRRTAIRTITRNYFWLARLFNVERIDLIGNRNLTTIDQKAFNGLTELHTLRVINCIILSNVNIHSFEGDNRLRQLIWHQNGPLTTSTLINLTRSVSMNVVPTLRHLHISSTSPNIDLKLAKDDLAHLSHLETISFVNCNLRFIHSFTFTFLSNLRSLVLIDNVRISLNNLIHVLSTLSQISRKLKLSHLNLSNSLIKSTISRPLFRVIGKLKIVVLYLRSISLRLIVKNDIPSMPNLERLYLDDNPLQSIEDYSFDKLINLQLLSLRKNHLHSIRSELFYNIPRLTHLYLSGDNTNASRLNIEPKTFVGLNLQVLDLSYRLMDPLPARIFLGLHKTQELYLRGCDLRQIEYLTFFFLKSLRLIDLSENPFLIETLRETHDDSFFGLESIEIVRMSQCNLTSSDLEPTNGIFSRIHEQVQELDLSQNLLTNLSQDKFSQFTQLKKLNLSNNHILPWKNQTIFFQNLELTQLDLNANELVEFTSSMFDDLIRMQNLSFGYNPIQCDCSNKLFNSDWLEKSLSNSITYMDSRNPLFSVKRYYCVDIHDSTRINIHKYRELCAKKLLSSKRVVLETYLVILFILTTVILISFVIMAITYLYYFELNQAVRKYLLKRSNKFEDDHKYEYDAFVSYNVSDSHWIYNQLIPNIEQSSNGDVRLCIYDRDFIAGRPISECIMDGIKQSRHVILVVSNQFVKSPWCQYETDLAYHHNTLFQQSKGIDGIILIKLEPLEKDLQIPVQLELLLKTHIYLEWCTDLNEESRKVFWLKLYKSLSMYNSGKRSMLVQKTNRLKTVREKLNFILQEWKSLWWLEDETLWSKPPDATKITGDLETQFENTKIKQNEQSDSRKRDSTKPIIVKSIEPA